MQSQREKSIFPLKSALKILSDLTNLVLYLLFAEPEFLGAVNSKKGSNKSLYKTQKRPL